MENLRKSSESGRKSSENREKTSLYVYIINRILHVRFWIRILSSRVQLDISRVGAANRHSKIKFVSTRGHVISVRIVKNCARDLENAARGRSRGHHYQARGHSFSLYGPTLNRTQLGSAALRELTGFIF